MTTVDTDVIPTHVVEVVAAEARGPHFQRVTFGGADGFRPVGPDQFVYVLLPPPGRRTLTIDETFRWTDYETMPVAERPVGAYYTVRAHRPEVAEIDCDFFLHEPAGVASAWSVATEPGAPAALWGPRTAWRPPADTDWWLLVADETGLPATAAILESLGSGATGRVLIEAAAGVDEDLSAPAGVTVTWTRRPAGSGPGTTSLLADAVGAMTMPVGARVYAWGGAEVRAMTAIRKYLRRTAGLGREQVSMTPYWRHPDHAGDVVADD